MMGFFVAALTLQSEIIMSGKMEFTCYFQHVKVSIGPYSFDRGLRKKRVYNAKVSDVACFIATFTAPPRWAGFLFHIYFPI